MLRDAATNSFFSTHEPHPTCVSCDGNYRGAYSIAYATKFSYFGFSKYHFCMFAPRLIASWRAAYHSRLDPPRVPVLAPPG